MIVEKRHESRDNGVEGSFCKVADHFELISSVKYRVLFDEVYRSLLRPQQCQLAQQKYAAKMAKLTNIARIKANSVSR